MEHFTQSISEDFSDYGGGHNSSNCNGLSGTVSETMTETAVVEREGETSAAPKELDIDAILNRAPVRFRHRRSRPLEEAPEFVKRLNAFEEVKAGTDVVFACQWKAFPNPSVKWYRDDEDITDISNNPRLSRESQVDGTEILTLTQATKKDEGAYKCKVENQEGVASTTGYLSVTGDIADVPLSTLHKGKKSEHSISSAPHLRTIVEQKSVEEREADAVKDQEPSPIQTFIDNFRREKTWPMYGTGYDPSNPEGGSFDSETSETSLESQDIDRVSFNVKETQINQSQPQDPNNLTVEPMIRAPSIEDIMAGLETEEEVGGVEKVEDYLKKQSQSGIIGDSVLVSGERGDKRQIVLPKLEIVEKECDTEEDEATSATPTNLLDGPEFQTTIPSNLVSNAIRSIELARERSLTPEKRSERSLSPEKRSERSLSPEKALDVRNIIVETEECNVILAQTPRAPKDKIKQVEELLDAIKEPEPGSDIQPDTPEKHKKEAEEKTNMDASDCLEIDLREIPIVMSRVLADHLELPWVYYLLFASSCAMFALATDLPIPIFVFMVAFLSFLSFRVLDHVN